MSGPELSSPVDMSRTVTFTPGQDAELLRLNAAGGVDPYVGATAERDALCGRARDRPRAEADRAEGARAEDRSRRPPCGAGDPPSARAQATAAGHRTRRPDHEHGRLRVCAGRARRVGRGAS